MSIFTVFFKTNGLSICKANSSTPLSTIGLNVFFNFIRSHSNSKCEYSIEVQTALNKQIVSEHNAAITYLNMAVNFLHPSVSYPGAGGYFMKMYEEELGHMKLLINYQIIRGGSPEFQFSKVDPIDPHITLVEAFTQALELEKKITQQLQNIIKTAEATEDYQIADFITSKFLAEQLYAINELSQHITKLKRLCDDKHAIYQFDSKLSKVYPYALKF